MQVESSTFSGIVLSLLEKRLRGLRLWDCKGFSPIYARDGELDDRLFASDDPTRSIVLLSAKNESVSSWPHSSVKNWRVRLRSALLSMFMATT